MRGRRHLVDHQTRRTDRVDGEVSATPQKCWHYRRMSATTNAPLKPIYPFNEPGRPIQLHRGDISGLGVNDVAGGVELRWTPDPTIVWTVDSDAPPQFANLQEKIPLVLHRPGGDVELPSYAWGIDGGWSNGAIFGSDSAPLDRVIAHWFNLPNWHGPELLETTEVGINRQWYGRLALKVDGWTITLDVRPDHSDIWRDLNKSDVYVMTHVMEIRRADGASFTPRDAEPVLTAMHGGISFALGRWAAPMLPVGLNGSGAAVWEEWKVGFCEQARSPSLGWWNEQDHRALADFLKLLISAFGDPSRRERLWMQMVLAITATYTPGLVEPRIMLGFSGLEDLMWQNLVLAGLMTEAEYAKKNPPTAKKLRRVLNAAKIPVAIDGGINPAIANLATDQLKYGQKIDGPEAVTWTRNRLIHPTPGKPNRNVYQYPGLLAEIWLLIRYYLILLILHSLGYQGACRDLRKLAGWAGSTVTVPWASAS